MPKTYPSSLPGNQWAGALRQAIHICLACRSSSVLRSKALNMSIFSWVSFVLSRRTFTPCKNAQLLTVAYIVAISPICLIPPSLILSISRWVYLQLSVPLPLFQPVFLFTSFDLFIRPSLVFQLSPSLSLSVYLPPSLPLSPFISLSIYPLPYCLAFSLSSSLLSFYPPASSLVPPLRPRAHLNFMLF